MTPDHHTQLLEAARNGNADNVRDLIIGSDVTHNTEALCVAAEHGHVECVALLIPVADPKANKSLAMHQCVKHQHTECLKILLPFSDANSCSGLALSNAAHDGYTEGVRLLIPLSDLEMRTRALALAAGMEHMDCVELLYPVSDPLEAVRRMKMVYMPKVAKSWEVLERMIAQEQNDTLRAAVNNGEYRHRARKM